jgi:hypothetical protein
MAGKTFRSSLESWIGQQVMVINPKSYRKTPISDGVTLETYEATLSSVEDDYVEFTFEARKRGEPQVVQQVVPLTEIRRISTWGGEKYVQL